jgi:hypothetical protein
MEKEDKIISTNTYKKEMFVLLPDGKKVPTMGTVTETSWESGRKDIHVVVDKPLALIGKSEN